MNKTDVIEKNRGRFIAMPGINRFSERLKIAMDGLTNVALASRCDISESAVRSYLSGKSYPGIDKIQAISEACEAPLIWLITGEDVAINSDFGAEFCDAQLAGVLSVMSNEQRRQLALAIVQYGLTGIFNALRGIESISEFAMLPENERSQLMRLHGKVKKGASDVSENNELDNSTHKNVGRA
ncbi:helix-turn-helix transcriptional regulator [Salmonella enterica]|nr:helix-turn-helix transcriptional regulator [Salmonella enterica]EEG5665088.1 helix-turn-helix transcriptional regulator [Salmonella enterica]EHZ6790411.1 helix-turn-helix transcriptional regulator [Salmonella enterica]EJH1281578.1 helix-turn-helix transcriptional regulator [Salmonella enterica]EJH6248642.1 helix-turn-helix transcriptional regulator [Salmonella enterica]